MPANTVIPIDDESLSTAVRMRLELELGLTYDVVKVTVLNGEVTLRGRMACQSKREAAKVTAESVRGVRRVLSDISTACYMAGSPSRSFAGRLRTGLSQILALNGMLTMGREIAAPKVVERAYDSECYCRKAEAAIEG